MKILNLLCLVLFLILLMGVQTWDPVKSCCSMNKNQSQRMIFSVPFYSERQNIDLWWRWVGGNLHHPKLFIRAISYLPDSVRDQIIAKIESLIDFRHKFAKLYPFNPPDRDMLGSCAQIFRIDADLYWSWKDDGSKRDTLPGNRRLTEAAPGRLLTQGFDDSGFFYPIKDGPDMDYKDLEENARKEFYRKLISGNMDSDFIYIPEGEFKSKRWAKNQFLQMSQYFCQIGYQEWIGDAYYNRIVKQYDPKWFLRFLTRLTFRGVTDAQAKKVLINWLSYVAASVWGDKKLKDFLAKNADCQRFC